MQAPLKTSVLAAGVIIRISLRKPKPVSATLKNGVHSFILFAEQRGKKHRQLKMITTLNILLFSVFDAETMVRNGGLLIICLAVFAQTGLFFCFFVPSGIFLFVGGMFVSTGKLEHDLITVCICSVLASVTGCSAGYWFGWKTGPLLYHKKDSRFFKQKYLKAAELFYRKHGQLALSLGMVFPITRTFAPIVAGIVRMNFWRFISYVFFGSALWIPLFIIGGYLVGIIPGIRAYLGYIMFAIILVVTVPAVTKIIREFKRAGKNFDDIS